MRELARSVVTAVVAAVVTALCMAALAREPKVLAEAPSSPLRGLSVHATGAFLTLISESGEVWVYDADGEVYRHFRVREVGQPLEKLKK